MTETTWVSFRTLSNCFPLAISHFLLRWLLSSSRLLVTAHLSTVLPDQYDVFLMSSLLSRVLQFFVSNVLLFMPFFLTWTTPPGPFTYVFHLRLTRAWLQVWIRMQIWQQMSIPTSWGWCAAIEKVEEKRCERISCFSLRSLFNWVVCLKIHVAPLQKSGKERVHGEASFRSVNLTSAARAHPSLRRGDKTKLCNKKDASAELRGIWRTYSQAQEYGQSYV